MRRIAALILAMAALFPAGVAHAQTILGELLDAGAKAITIDQFKQEIVQRFIVGPTPTGGRVEVIYTVGGEIQGRGFVAAHAGPLHTAAGGVINGRWTVDDQNRICTSLWIMGSPGIGTGAGTLPPRCQFWFKSGTSYYLAESDWDRSAKVLLRTIKP